MAERDIGNYSISSVLGNGISATVYLAHHKILKFPVAVKVLSKKRSQALQFSKEVEFMKSLDHPYIQYLYEIVEDENNYYLVSEVLMNGSLTQRVPVCEEAARVYFMQIMSAIDYLHKEKKILHRDIKSDNVLIDTKNRAKLIDFGMSTFYEPGEDLKRTACGSPVYTAPEVFMRDLYGDEADVYSCGVLLFQMITGRLPFFDENITKLFKKVTFCPVEFPEDIKMTDSIKDLLIKMLEKDKKKRISIAEIYEHEWVKAPPTSTLYAVPSIGINTYNSNESICINKYNSCICNVEKLGEEININDNKKEEIINKMVSLGFNASEVRVSVENEDFGELYGIYRIIKRNRELYMSITKTGLRPQQVRTTRQKDHVPFRNAGVSLALVRRANVSNTKPLSDLSICMSAQQKSKIRKSKTGREFFSVLKEGHLMC